jgi:thiosulfate dehydrogenase
LEQEHRTSPGFLAMSRQLLVGIMIGAVGVASAFVLADKIGAPLPAGPPSVPVQLQSAGAFEPRSATDAPDDAFGDAVRLGEQLITDTVAHAPQYVGNGLKCSNCHLDAGRKAGAAPLWAAFVNFPAFRAKNGEINTFQKRVQDCFLYSLNGTPPPLGSRELIAIESYAAFMARGLPSGMSPPGRGFPEIGAPPKAPDDRRGSEVFAQKCSACHGANGAGQKIAGGPVYPPLWGAQSYNWGAGMARIDKAAAFIRANMPQGSEGSLTVQEAWDVAHYIDGKTRPQDPRFITSAGATRALHQDTPYSRYGTVAGGVLLGDPSNTPPSGPVR